MPAVNAHCQYISLNNRLGLESHHIVFLKKWLDYRHQERLKRPLHLQEVRYVGEMAQRIASLLALGPALDASYLAIKAETLALNAR